MPCIEGFRVPTPIGFLANGRADLAVKFTASTSLIINDAMEKFDLQQYVTQKIKDKIDQKIDTTIIHTTCLLILISSHFYI